jgi:ribose transport system substrate-binding protein
MTRRDKRSRAHVRMVAGAAAACAVVTACAAHGSTGGAPAAATRNGTGAADGSCATVSYQAPGGTADLSGLPAAVRAGYSGYFQPVNKSVYANFKSTAKAPYTIGYSDSFSANSWRGDALTELRADTSAYEKAGLVASLQTANSNLDNSLQIQQITSMIDQHVDAIIAIPNSPTAFDGVIKQAYEAGIPFITLDSHVDSPYAINVDTNYFLTGELVASGIAKIINGNGNVVVVDGIDGAPASGALASGYRAALAHCPGITVAGSVEGDWSEATAKSVMLQYLATHPGQISAAIGGGGETTGILQAMQQTGRSLVPIGDANPDEGSLVALKNDLPDKYVASTDPPQQSMDAALRVAIATLQGQGPKYNTIVANPPQITGESALGNWIQSGWTTTSAAAAPAPPGISWLPASEMSDFFTHSAALPALP